MKIIMKPVAGLIALLVALCGASLAAQGGPGGRPGRPGGVAPGDDAVVTPAEIQRMFDAYAALQAQQQLEITDEQYPRFLARFKALQDIRRKALQDHTRIVLELNRMLTQGQSDEAQLKERIQALQDLDARSSADIRKAYEAIDQVLDVRQQARFRVFEERMERRKLELMTRARQANRPKQ